MTGFQATPLIERGECAFISVLFSRSVRRSRVPACEREIVCMCAFRQINHLRVTFIIILSHLFFCYLAANICVLGSLSPLHHSVPASRRPRCCHCVCILFIALASTGEMRGNFLSIQSGAGPDVKLNGIRERRLFLLPVSSANC